MFHDQQQVAVSSRLNWIGGGVGVGLESGVGNESREKFSSGKTRSGMSLICSKMG